MLATRERCLFRLVSVRAVLAKLISIPIRSLLFGILTLERAARDLASESKDGLHALPSK